MRVSLSGLQTGASGPLAWPRTHDLRRLVGDINSDGWVDSSDLIAAKAMLGDSAIDQVGLDINLDGVVSIADLATIKASLGQTVP